MLNNSGFEPTPPKRMLPKMSALEHSATLPDCFGCCFLPRIISVFQNLFSCVGTLNNARGTLSYFQLPQGKRDRDR